MAICLMIFKYEKVINLEMLVYEKMVITISIKTEAWCNMFASRFQLGLILKVNLLF
jgi:hypothetical protein